MILIATVTILLTMVLITVVYYDLFRRQVLEDLKSYGSLLKSCSSVEEIKENGVPVESDLRLTLIGSDGQVLYDNEADSVAMGNHASRPEIQEAMRDGEGEAVRNSETLSQSTFLLCHPPGRWQHPATVQGCQKHLQHFQSGAAHDGGDLCGAAGAMHGGGQSADHEAGGSH